MNNFSHLFLLTVLIVSCNNTTKTNNSLYHQTNESKEKTNQRLTPKVTGIGGIFFGTQNPEATKKWYSKNLGLVIDDYGSAFEFRNANSPHEINYLRWSPFEKGSDAVASSEREFMINYRVQNIEGMVEKLKSNGVTIIDDIESFEYGKFVHVMDDDGNKLELWEPIDSALTEMRGNTTK